jgi:hypothetical protein
MRVFTAASIRLALLAVWRLLYPRQNCTQRWLRHSELIGQPTLQVASVEQHRAAGGGRFQTS